MERVICAKIARVLQKISTKSTYTHTIPSDWKKARISPIFKRGTKIEIYSHPEHLPTKPNEPKFIRYGRIGPQPLLTDDHDSRYPYLTKKEKGDCVEKNMEPPPKTQNSVADGRKRRAPNRMPYKRLINHELEY